MATHLLIPVGNRDMCLAAIHNGADEVYFGVPGFNARGRTVDFELDDMRELIDLCHLYGVKVNLAFNVVIFEEEIRELEEFIRELVRLCPDAFIVQDIGLIRLIKTIAPLQQIHVSTQMTITHALAIEALSDLDIKRVTLSREMSLAEIQEVSARTDIELEVFVHGALCVAYSGQCLTSEIFGGRSANRGQCAQTCRLDYELIVDGTPRDLAGKKYLLSPQDLCGVDEIPKLQEMGIAAIKIEGRLKSPAYVASTASNYRAVLEKKRVPETAKQQMELLFSRGFYSGWLEGVNHQELVKGYISSHQGSYVGEVVRVAEGRKVEITSRITLKPGDGVSFIDFEHGDRIGARVYGVELGKNCTVLLNFGNEFSPVLLQKGWKVYQNDAPDLERELQKSFTQSDQLKTYELDMIVTAHAELPVQISATTSDGYTSLFQSCIIPEKAKSMSVSSTILHEEFKKLGKSCYTLHSLKAEIEEGLYLSQKNLRTIRQELIQHLNTKRTAHPAKELFSAEACMPKLIVQADIKQGTLSVLVREEEQIAALTGLPIETVYLDFDYGRTYEKAMQQVREMGYKVSIATLRVVKPFDTAYLDRIAALKPDSVLVRNLAALEYFRNTETPFVSDYSFNVCNSLAAQWMHEKRCVRITPGHDLNFMQLSQMMRYTPGDQLEIILHHYMPTFYMEYCPYAAHLSKGTDVRTCGKPCRKHRISLKDHRGVTHPVKPDYACRNTMYHGVPQSSARLIPRFKAMGISHYRIEALYETQSELRNKVETYAKALRGELSSAEVFDRLKVDEKYGISEGQLLSTAQFQNRKKISG